MKDQISKQLTHPEVSVLPVVVPHVIVHDFIEAVTDVVTPENVHGALGVETCLNKLIWLTSFHLSNYHYYYCYTALTNYTNT